MRNEIVVQKHETLVRDISIYRLSDKMQTYLEYRQHKVQRTARIIEALTL